MLLACFFCTPHAASATQHHDLHRCESGRPALGPADEPACSSTPVGVFLPHTTWWATEGPQPHVLPAMHKDFCTCVGVFGFRASTHKFQLPLEDGDGVECFWQLIRECGGYDSPETSLIAVAPQPAADFFASMVFPRALVQRGKIPALLQVFGSEVVEFLDVFGIEICIEALRYSLGHLWESDTCS